MTFPKCKYDLNLLKDSRPFLRLAGTKYVEVTINNRKGDDGVIFTMMDNPELHKVPNGYEYCTIIVCFNGNTRILRAKSPYVVYLGNYTITPIYIVYLRQGQPYTFAIAIQGNVPV